MAIARSDQKILLGATALALLFWANIGLGILRPANGSFVLKWLPTMCLALIVFQRRESPRSLWLFTGLLIQSLGAVILDFDRIGYVLYALAFTALAHLCFAGAFMPRAFSLSNMPRTRLAAAGVFLVYALGYGSYAAMHSASRGMQFPVVLYMLCLSAGMLAALFSGRHWLVALGMAMFVLDDTVFSYHLFVSPIPPNHFITWPSYFTGQALLTIGFASSTAKTENAVSTGR